MREPRPTQPVPAVIPSARFLIIPESERSRRRYGFLDPEERRKHRAAGTGVDYAEGIKLTDPRRMAVYFAKYGTAGGKEYQHRVPAGVARRLPRLRGLRPGLPAGPRRVPRLRQLRGRGRRGQLRGPVLGLPRPAPGPRRPRGYPGGRHPRRTGPASLVRAKGLTKRVRRERVDQATGRVSELSDSPSILRRWRTDPACCTHHLAPDTAGTLDEQQGNQRLDLRLFDQARR